MSELKPCPFCGCVPESADGKDYAISSVICETCDNIEVMDWEVNKAIDKWNIRPIEDELQRKLDIAVEALKQYDHPDEDEYNWRIAHDAIAEINRIPSQNNESDGSQNMAETDN